MWLVPLQQRIISTMSPKHSATGRSFVKKGARLTCGHPVHTKASLSRAASRKRCETGDTPVRGVTHKGAETGTLPARGNQLLLIGPPVRKTYLAPGVSVAAKPHSMRIIDRTPRDDEACSQKDAKTHEEKKRKELTKTGGEVVAYRTSLAIRSCTILCFRFSSELFGRGNRRGTNY